MSYKGPISSWLLYYPSLVKESILTFSNSSLKPSINPFVKCYRHHWQTNTMCFRDKLRPTSRLWALTGSPFTDLGKDFNPTHDLKMILFILSTLGVKINQFRPFILSSFCLRQLWLAESSFFSQLQILLQQRQRCRIKRVCLFPECCWWTVRRAVLGSGWPGSSSASSRPSVRPCPSPFRLLPRR